MGEICEICLKTIKHWEIIPNYDSIILCEECSNKVDEIYYNSNKTFEECVKEIRKKEKNS